LGRTVAAADSAAFRHVVDLGAGEADVSDGNAHFERVIWIVLDSVGIVSLAKGQKSKA
jgi:hypothetical protein